MASMVTSLTQRQGEYLIPSFWKAGRVSKSNGSDYNGQKKIEGVGGQHEKKGRS